MNRKIVIVLALMAFVVGMIGVLAVAHGATPDVVVINKAQAKKPPVTFPHAKHVKEEGIKCQVCHHTTEGDATPESCFNCHGKDPKIPDPASASSKNNPFHIRCKGCHQERGEGPTKCTQCHKG
jgi:hypothetical protein